MSAPKLNLNKGNIYALVLLLSMLAVYTYRNYNKPKDFYISGKTMGTTYNIKYLSKSDVNHQTAIDSVLVEFNKVFSTYIPNSEISTLNTNGKHTFKSPLFYQCLEKSKEVFSASNGAFDPTVMPLVNAWGFGFKNMENVDSTTIDSLKQYVGFEKIQYNKDSIWTTVKGTMLDLSAISKGFGVDIVADYLVKNGISDFMVEIGGEVSCKGKNGSGKIWTLGIENPKATTQQLFEKVELENKAMATSGNYRNFYEKDGKKYAHTINPTTGFPAENDMLSATVFAPDCMSADAYATAFMVLGKEKSVELASKLKDIKVFFIYSDPKGEMKVYKN